MYEDLHVDVAIVAPQKYLGNIFTVIDGIFAPYKEQAQNPILQTSFKNHWNSFIGTKSWGRGVIWNLFYFL